MVGNSSIPTKPFVINQENLVLSSKELEISEATGRGAGEQMPLLRETRSRGPGCVSLCPRPSLLPRAATSIKGRRFSHVLYFKVACLLFQRFREAGRQHVHGTRAPQSPSGASRVAKGLGDETSQALLYTWILFCAGEQGVFVWFSTHMITPAHTPDSKPREPGRLMARGGRPGPAPPPGSASALCKPGAPGRGNRGRGSPRGSRALASTWSACCVPFGVRCAHPASSWGLASASWDVYLASAH